jgi:hypothetical protein
MQQGTMAQGAMQQGGQDAMMHKDMTADKGGMMGKDMMDKDQIHWTIEKLEHMKTDWQKSGDDWGGKRMDAMKNVDAAMAELQKADDTWHASHSGKDMSMDHKDMQH